MSSCHWKTLVPFCLQKKGPENTLLTLTVIYRKIVATSKTWTRTLDPDPEPGPWTRPLDPRTTPWTRTLKNLDTEKPGP